MNPSWSNLTLTAVLLAALTGCGSSEPEPDAQERRRTERITPGGIAALVDEHLGADNVKRYGSYGEEEGSVDVMVQLRRADRRDMFVVGVASPDQADREFPGAAGLSCRELQRHGERRGGRLWCEDFSDGGVAYVQLVPYGFSDDNADGRTLGAMAAHPDGRWANAMYESYALHVGIDAQDLLALMADERLAWSTDPAVNEAGRDIDVRPLAGG